MRRWLAMFPAFGVLLGGCARRAERPPAVATPRPQPATVSIVFADPSPAGNTLLVGLVKSGSPVDFDRTPRPADTLWLVNLRTGAARDLTPEGGERPRPPGRLAMGRPSWRPDGAALALTTMEGRIAIHEVASGDSRIVSPEGVRCISPVWSPDGQRLAFAVTEPSRRLSGVWRVSGLYSMPADGSAPPRLEADDLAGRWYWSARGRRLRYLANPHRAAGRADPKSIAEPIPLEELRYAGAVACSPDRTKLAYSGPGDVARGSQTTVVDASFAPVMRWADADVPARGLWWSPDSTRLLTRNSSGHTYLLDLATKTDALVDDPVAANKEPAGWIRWRGKQQLLFIDEGWKRLVVMENIDGPAYTLLALGEDGAPSLILPLREED